MSATPEDSGQSQAVEIPPEHIVTPQLRRRLQQCYDHACKLLQQEKPDRDYANTLFTQCVVADPSNLVYVEAFLRNLQEKYENNKRGARSFFGGGGKNRAEFKKAVAKNNWIDVLRLGPELLHSNPWDVSVLRPMAQACAAFHYNEVELRYLKNALDANPKDIEVNRHCALSLARVGQFDQAIACWHRIEELRPNDQEAKRMIAELTVERHRPQAARAAPGARRAAAGRTAATPPEEKKAQEQAEAASAAVEVTSANRTPEGPEEAQRAEEKSGRRELTLTPIQRLERAIITEPEIVENYLELIDLYVAAHRFNDAQRVLQRAQSVLPGDLDILSKGEDLFVAIAEHQLLVARQQAESQKTAEAEQLVQQCEEEVLRRQLSVLDARCQRFPDNHQLKMELGLLLKKSGNYRSAAERFQEARNDPQFYVQATFELGECLQRLHQYVKALHCYQRAAEKAGDSSEEQAIKKLSLYRAGLLAAGLKEYWLAEQYLERLLALDPSYKDAASRLDKVRQISNKG